MHRAIGQARIAFFFQIHGAQCYESKQHIVCVTPEPDALSDGWADPATAGTTMTLVAARQPELLDEIGVVLRQLSVIRDRDYAVVLLGLASPTRWEASCPQPCSRCHPPPQKG